MMLRSIALFALGAVCSFSVCAGTSDIDQVRAFGVRVKQLSDVRSNGTSISASQLSAMRREFDSLRQILATADAANVRKLDAINVLLSQLAIGPAQTETAGFSAARTTMLDSESVVAKRGMSCDHALGITQGLPVQVTLASGASAWFEFTDATAASIAFGTDSTGPDPALEIFESCKSTATPLASDDDTVGLDARAIANPNGQPLYVRLSNTGNAGAIRLAASTTPQPVSGTVRDAKTNQPIPNAQVGLVTSNGGFNGSSSTDSGGNYSITPYNTGSYYVYASGTIYASPPTYVSEVYPSATCPPNGYFYNISLCNLGSAQTVNVTTTTPLTHINFSLPLGQHISGSVRASNNEPIVQGQVALFDANGNDLTSVQTDSGGHFLINAVPTGTYKLEAIAAGYASQMYNGVTCGGTLLQTCNLGLASNITIGTQDITDIAFSLAQLPSIRGYVSDQSGDPIIGASVYVYDTNGNGVYTATTYANNSFVAGPLNPGNYYVAATAPGFFTQLYLNHDCMRDCTSEVAAGTLITLPLNGSSSINFNLDPTPVLHGRVVDAATALPIANVSINLNSNPPGSIGYPNFVGTTDASGNYSIGGLAAGTYYVWARSPAYVDQLFDGIPCELLAQYPYSGRCDVASATLITVAPGSTLPDADFSLTQSSTLEGMLTVNAGPGSDLPAASGVQVYDNTATLVAQVMADAQGHYIVSDLQPGNYYIEAGTYNYYYGPFVEQLWKNIPCPTNNCVPTQGTVIPIAASQHVTGIDFNLTQTNTVVGRVVSDEGLPVQGVVIDLFNATTGAYLQSGATDAEGFYAVSSSAASSFVLGTEAGGGYVDQVYAGISCPNGTAYAGKCSLAQATVVNLPSNQTQPVIANFVLHSLDRIFNNGFE